MHTQERCYTVETSHKILIGALVQKYRYEYYLFNRFHFIGKKLQICITNFKMILQIQQFSSRHSIVFSLDFLKLIFFFLLNPFSRCPTFILIMSLGFIISECEGFSLWSLYEIVPFRSYDTGNLFQICIQVKV